MLPLFQNQLELVYYKKPLLKWVDEDAMNAKIQITVMLFLLLGADTPMSAENLTDLRSWSIPTEKIRKPTEPRDEVVCRLGAVARDDSRTQSFVHLLRKKDRKVVAIVELRKDGTTGLNPDGFNYGPIPPLIELTPTQADVLWGASLTPTTSEREKTFELNTFAGATYFIDLKFENNQVQEYRVRAQELDTPRFRTHTAWCTLERKKQGGGGNPSSL